MEYSDIRDRILLATLPNVPFDGWSSKALRLGAEGAGFDREAADRAFPGGPAEAVGHFIDLANRMMEADLGDHDLSALKLPEKIRLAIKLRLERWAVDREAVRRGLALLSLPGHARLSLKSTYATVDGIWHAVGDRSVDFSFYTKRAELAAIYGATLLVWLEDTSEDSGETWAFLDRRLEGVIRLRRARAKLRERMTHLPTLPRLLNPLELVRKPFGLMRSMRMR
ncbi:hypothetical protein CKO38_07850 [Rhodospirillum rubrum]|uniref:COQ9 family protein n=1 Tax=Rhodospirillum rubrum TaxID=1085 RepID=UPI00190440B6|nr:COQ9 family protein [Rhodospirillum rubrum]MBK1665035.1 hypothetical protein [Rhodospirillum rubrum]MBK1676584.1 hypothetical protein [Rhodospirillum rubrum]